MRRSPFVAAVLAATVIASTLVASAPPGVAGDDEPGLVPTRVATYNFRAERPLGKFQDAIDELKTRAAVIGLQEIAQKEKNDHLLEDDTWGYYRPPELRQNPVIWDTDVYDLVSTPGGHRIVEGREIEDKAGGTESRDDSYATVVRLEHILTGNMVTIINVHLLSGASRVGLPYPGRPKRFGFLVDQIQGTVRLLEREKELDTEVFLLGDFNVGYQADVRERHKKLPYRKYKRQGFESMWQGGELEEKGTFDNAYLDQVWATVAPLRREVARDIKGSDHHPAIATYLLDIELPLP
ncbi:MAG: endonuclease/exonuclease/phosphatase family protein [Nocardioides sp.]